MGLRKPLTTRTARDALPRLFLSPFAVLGSSMPGCSSGSTAKLTLLDENWQLAKRIALLTGTSSGEALILTDYIQSLV
jgi:hypothetical protein